MKKKISIITLILIIILLILLVIYLLFIKEKSFTITFDTDGATNITEISVKEKEQIKLPANPKKDGYIFSCWTSNGKVVLKNTLFKEDTLLKAVWIKDDVKTVTVKFADDKELGSEIIEKGKNIILPSVPTKEGYTFGGFLDHDNKFISKDTIIDKDITLKIYWIKKNTKTHTIKFDTDGISSIENIVIEEGKNIILPVNPKKDGYVFKEFIDSEGNIITKDTIVNKDMTLKAVFVKPYTCPSECTPTNDGSKCTKTITTNMISKSTCPSGYTLKNGKCLSGSKYHATNSNGTWKCNSNSDYMYSEEDGVGGAFMWCVKTTNVVSSKTCPSSYTKDNNTCKKTQTINCTKN